MDQQPTLETRRLRLRPFTLKDAPQVHALAGDHRVSEMTVNVPHPYEDGMAEAWIASHHNLFTSRRAIIYSVIIRTTEEMIGAVSLNQVTEKDGNLGYWIGFPYWGNGYCTEAVEALVDFAFKQFGLPLIYARHLRENVASGRVIQKSGFNHKGSISIELKGQRRILEHYERQSSLSAVR